MTISDFSIVQSAVVHLIHLVNIRVSVDSNDVDTNSFVHIKNQLLSGLKLKRVKMDMCARTTFENITNLLNIEQLSIVWCQMQELTHLLQYSPYLSTLKATIYGINDGNQKKPSILNKSRFFMFFSGYLDRNNPWKSFSST
jgi:hypothetical protein